MLIPARELRNILRDNGIGVTGILHVGAFECEEMEPYLDYFNVEPDDIVWIDAVPRKVEEMRAKGIPNVYTAVVTDQDDVDVSFHVSNNVASSSVLELGTHKTEYPSIHYTETLRAKTVTLDTFFARNNLDPSKYTLWNLDIQGAEGLAFKGAQQSLQHAQALYVEVNERELYKECMLLPELDAYLADRGFRRVRTEMTPYGWGDAVYIR